MNPTSAISAERALRSAATLAAAEAVVLLAVVVVRGGRSTTAVVVALLVKLACCHGVLHRRPGAFLALVLYEAATVLFALTAPGVAPALRLAAAASSAVTLTLLGRSARLFPSPPLPKP